MLNFSKKKSDKPRYVVSTASIVTIGLMYLCVCAAVGVGAYRLSVNLGIDNTTIISAVDKEADEVLQQQLMENKQRIAEQREELAKARQFSENHLNALGAKLGLIQAQVVRLNAFGKRLTDISGLDKGEFSFDDVPGIGGANDETESDEFPNTEFMQTLTGLEAELAANEQQLSVLEALIMDRNLNQTLFPDSWPMAGGWVSSKFGYRRDPFKGNRNFHHGIDIVNKPDTKIQSVAAGVVSFAGTKPFFGSTVEIQHGNDYVTRYGHTSEILVKVGERVQKGQAIAIVGSTGKSTGTHLHFEVHKGAQRVDPLKYLRAVQ